jgi:hypothetical protein
VEPIPGKLVKEEDAPAGGGYTVLTVMDCNWLPPQPAMQAINARQLRSVIDDLNLKLVPPEMSALRGMVN